MNPETSRSVISATGLTRLYKLGNSEVVGINQVDLEIAAGELVVLKGNSGSGKSTLLSLLAGLDRPTRGDLRVADHDLNKTSDSDLTHFRRQVVGMVFQSFNLLPTLNVVENTCLPALLAGKSFAQSRSKAMELLKWLGLDKRLNHLPAQIVIDLLVELNRKWGHTIMIATHSSLADGQATIKIFLQDGMITNHP
jgi:putative ABC transport system ATP-binding protein